MRRKARSMVASASRIETTGQSFWFRRRAMVSSLWLGSIAREPPRSRHRNAKLSLQRESTRGNVPPERRAYRQLHSPSPNDRQCWRRQTDPGAAHCGGGLSQSDLYQKAKVGDCSCKEESG